MKFRFSLGQTNEPYVLQHIKNIIGFGSLMKSEKNHYTFSCQLESADILKEYFDKYPLKSIKSIDYTQWFKLIYRKRDYKVRTGRALKRQSRLANNLLCPRPQGDEDASPKGTS